MKFLTKNKGVVIFYLVIVISTLMFVEISSQQQIDNTSNSNLFVQK